MSPTDPYSRTWRYLVTGHFEETPGYSELRPHGCHDYLLIYTLAGGGLFRHEAGQFTTRRHDVVLIAPRFYHGYATDPDQGCWKLLWAHFVPEPTWQDLLRWPEEGAGVGRLTIRPPEARRQIVDRLGACHRLATCYARRRERLGMNALESVLLLCGEQNPARQSPKLDPRIREVMDHIHRRLDDDLSVQALSKLAGLSPSRFAHLFRDQLDVSPQQFVERVRVDRAKDLLERTAYPVRRIAEEIGFADPLYFSRRFRQATALSPGAYRRRFLAG